MPEKPPIERISEYFDNKSTVFLTGILFFLYFLHFFFTDDDIVAKIFPPLSHLYYLVLAFVVMIYQLVTWHSFHLLKGKWYYHFKAWALFLSEMMIILFLLSLISWPAYWVSLFFQYLARSR